MTFINPASPRLTLAERYRTATVVAPRPNPNRFALRRLGLSEAEFENRFAAEVDETLRQIMAERRWAQLQPNDPSLARALTREDARTMFQAIGVPTSGSLVGVFAWAYGHHAARFNFDVDGTPEQLAFFEEYD